MNEEEVAAHGYANEEADEIKEEECLKMMLSLDTISGNVDLNILKVKRFSYNRKIQLLVDNRSINYFLDEESTHNLGCRLEYAKHMIVSVGDGNKVISGLHCPYFTWEGPGQPFTYPLRIIKFRGCHKVLRGDWLRLCNPIEFDYEEIKVNISKDEKRHTPEAPLEDQSCRFVFTKAMTKLLKKVLWNYVTFCSISMQKLEPIDHDAQL
ncbi:UNVERIFIED_CONTAM: hypothetical protein Sradi_2671000 [Sesamum radiatum]|uniref:Uncharacterized protein n=1 Tax=Sesamum radiatum TaxID=300843 RepID=A0AAW2S7C9_SESRA